MPSPEVAQPGLINEVRYRLRYYCSTCQKELPGLPSIWESAVMFSRRACVDCGYLVKPEEIPDSPLASLVHTLEHL